ncbi:MAG: hypothetical protein HP497_04960 [Nitrospira sp.]|nr:hypothetical protein [Nitrospira sp.]
MPRVKKYSLDDRERRFVQGIVEGKSMTQAAKDAGYAKSTAEKKASVILNRPLVQSMLTRALEGLGLTMEGIVRPIADGLKATRSAIITGKIIDSQIPDHQVRLGAHDRAVKLLGGIPKVGESLPASQGLNLFVAVEGEKP